MKTLILIAALAALVVVGITWTGPNSSPPSVIAVRSESTSGTETTYGRPSAMTMTVSSTGSGTAGSVASVRELAEAATLVAVGEVTQVVYLGDSTVIHNDATGEMSVPVKQFGATVRIDRLLKGTGSRDIVVEFSFPKGNEFDARGTAIGIYGLFALTGPNALGRYVPVDRVYPFIWANATDPASSGPLMEKVLAEMKQVLENRSELVEKKAELLRMLDILLNREVNSTAISTVRNIAQDPASLLNYEASAVLLSHNDITTLTPVTDALVARDPIALENAPLLGDSIGVGVRNPVAVSDLQRLQTCIDPEVRQGAANSLRFIGTPDVIAALCRPGLDDSDFMVRYRSVIALSEIMANNEYAPSRDEFAINESYYLDYWKSWRDANGF